MASARTCTGQNTAGTASAKSCIRRNSFGTAGAKTCTRQTTVGMVCAKTRTGQNSNGTTIAKTCNGQNTAGTASARTCTGRDTVGTASTRTCNGQINATARMLKRHAVPLMPGRTPADIASRAIDFAPPSQRHRSRVNRLIGSLQRIHPTNAAAHPPMLVVGWCNCGRRLG